MTAQGTEARRGETVGLDAKRDGPVGVADAPQTTDNRENIVTTSEQQAVPVAQEDREAACATYLRFRYGQPPLYTNIAAGRIDHDPIVQAFARHRLASLPCKSGEGAGERELQASRLDRIREDGGPLTLSDKAIMRETAALLRMPSLDLAGCPECGFNTCLCDGSPNNPATDATQTREAECELYLVWSNEHRAWWGKDQRGYTKIIANAGRYDRDTALTIAGTRGGGWRLNKGNPDEIAIPEADAIDQYASITAEQLNARGGA